MVRKSRPQNDKQNPRSLRLQTTRRILPQSTRRIFPQPTLRTKTKLGLFAAYTSNPRLQKKRNKLLLQYVYIGVVFRHYKYEYSQNITATLPEKTKKANWLSYRVVTCYHEPPARRGHGRGPNNNHNGNGDKNDINIDEGTRSRYNDNGIDANNDIDNGTDKTSISIKVPDHGITITGSIPIMMSVTGPITISATITTSTPTTLTETNRYRYLATTIAKPDR